VAVSHDGGKTWIHQQALGASPNAQVSSDKNSTTADPVHAGVAYTVWDDLISPTDQPDDRIHAAAYTGPAMMSKTTDFGVTWSPVQAFINTMNRQQTIGNIIVIDPRTDTLYDFTDLIVPPNTPKQGTLSNAVVAFVKSSDGGATWTQPQVIAPFDALGVVDPNTGEPARVGDGLEEVAIDPASGKLYVVWESSTNFKKNANQAAGSFDNEVLLSSSADGGATWSAPRATAGPSALPIFTPTVAVNAAGTVAVTYYDSKDLSPTNTSTWPIDYFVTYSTDGGATFGAPQLIAGPFDNRSAPVARGFFLGDYEGLQSTGSGFVALFVKTNCDLSPADPNAPPSGNPLCGPASSTAAATPNTNPTDVFSAILTPPGH
jgi:Neuraminidase (sialidase)